MSPWNWTRNYVTSNQKIRNAFITPTDSICEYIRGKHRELLSTFLNNPISPVKTDSIHELAEYISTYANSLFHVLLTIFWSRLKNEWYNELLEKIEWKYDWVWYEILYYSLIRLDTIWVIHTYCCFMMCRAFFVWTKTIFHLCRSTCPENREAFFSDFLSSELGVDSVLNLSQWSSNSLTCSQYLLIFHIK